MTIPHPPPRSIRRRTFITPRLVWIIWLPLPTSPFLPQFKFFISLSSSLCISIDASSSSGIAPRPILRFLFIYLHLVRVSPLSLASTFFPNFSIVSSVPVSSLAPFSLERSHPPFSFFDLPFNAFIKVPNLFFLFLMPSDVYVSTEGTEFPIMPESKAIITYLLTGTNAHAVAWQRNERDTPRRAPVSTVSLSFSLSFSSYFRL